MSSLTRRERVLNKRMDAILAADGHPARKRWVTSRALRRMLGNPLSVVGLVVVAVVVLVSLAAPLIAPYDPAAMDLRTILRPPSLEHWLGTDKIGRDVLSRVMYGGRISILVGLGSALGATAIGVLFGIYGGYVGGWFDKIVFRISELVMAFPQIILVLLLVSLIGQSTANLIIIFIGTGWGGIYRMARSQALALREEEYVTALKAFGINRIVVCFRHILPNALGPIGW